MTSKPSNWEAHMIALAQSAAEQLEGTSKGIHDLGIEYEEAINDIIFCSKLDELVFECQCCNNWFEQSQMADRKDGEWICEDCTDDNERNN